MATCSYDINGFNGGVCCRRAIWNAAINSGGTKRPFCTQHLMVTMAKYTTASVLLEKIRVPVPPQHGTDHKCSEVEAAWCAVHGDCVCPRYSHMNSAECPLHGTPGGVVGDTQIHRDAWDRFRVFLVEVGNINVRLRETHDGGQHG